MKKYFAVITNSRSTSNLFENECGLSLRVFESKEARDNFVKDLEKYSDTPIVRKYFEFCM
jgi:hypothetical protein